MHLITDRWYAVLAAGEVPAGKPIAARRMGRDMVFWRDARGAVVAALDVCPHRRAKLSPGRLKGGCIECPFHGFVFNGEGACTSIPAHPDRPISGAMSLHTLPAREEHGFVWLWTGPAAAPSEPVPFFDFTGFDATGSQFTVDVNTHYTRAIENQLDFTHLPFVHRTTIGRFASVEVDARASFEGDLLRASQSGSSTGIEFLGPNIWRLKTGPTWQFLAFAPIDDTHMRYYLRSYQPWTRSRPLAWLVGKAGTISSRFIVGQDTAVVESQPAGETRLRMGEVLLPSDIPIIAYRRWREERRFEFAPGVRLGLVDDDSEDSLESPNARISNLECTTLG